MCGWHWQNAKKCGKIEWDTYNYFSSQLSQKKKKKKKNSAKLWSDPLSGWEMKIQ